MRIVISNPRRGWGGTSSMALDLARGLRDRGHEVVVFCNPHSRLRQEVEASFALEPILRGADFPLPAILRCVRALRRHRPDVVLSAPAHDLAMTGVAAKLCGIPLVARRVDTASFPQAHRRALDRLVDHFIANSRATRDSLLRSATWLDEARVSTVYNGIDVERFSAAAAADLGLPPGSFAVGFVGRLVERKGVLEVASAWRRVAPLLPAAHLVITGAGAAESEMRRLLQSAPRVHWLGFRRDIPAILQALDVALMPSWEEPFGLVAAEAMAAGVPVIAGRAGGLLEVVQDEVNGLLVPPRDADALAEAVLRLAGDDDLRRRLARTGVQRAATIFSAQRMVEKYEAVLQSVVEGNRLSTDL